MNQDNDFEKKHFFLKCGFFLGIFIVILTIFILICAHNTSAETTANIQDVSNEWINETSGSRLVFNIILHNNSAGSGNEMQWINVTFLNT